MHTVIGKKDMYMSITEQNHTYMVPWFSTMGKGQLNGKSIFNVINGTELTEYSCRWK